MLRLVFAGLLSAILGPAVASADSACRSDTIDVRGEWGQARFRVEVADDHAERAQGLMHRKQMSAGAGMLFVYQKTAAASFWMENTLIPLDMLFADERGRITHIHHNAIPLDRTPISSAGPVRYVLEINGGLSQAMGLTVGSELRHPSILQNLAIWPCEASS